MNKILTDDALSILPTLPSVNLIVTSPPYPGQYGDQRTPSQWLAWFEQLTNEFYHVLTDDGVLALNVMFKRNGKGWFDLRLFQIPHILKAAGLNMLDIYMWTRPNPAPNGPLTYADLPAWEPVFVATKAKVPGQHTFNAQRQPYSPKSIKANGYTKTGNDRDEQVTPNASGARLTNVLAVSSASDQQRPRAKGVSFPRELPRRFILQYTNPGDVVLDPFCGAGTTCREAQINGRQYIGIDIDPDETAKAQEWMKRPYNLPLLERKPVMVNRPLLELMR